MKFIFLIASLFFIISCSFAQSKKSLKVYTDYNFYYDPSLGEYIELKFQFDANSLVLVKENSWFRSKVDVEIQLLKDIIYNKNIEIEKLHNLIKIDYDL
jgi:predicted nicotinamide N-methyase